MIAETERPSVVDADAATLDFVLPPELEAHEPPEARGLARDEVRLLVSYRGNDRVVHSTFLDLPWFLDAGDLLIVNDSATLPAALSATLEDGREVALHLSTQRGPHTWIVEPRHASLAAGAMLRLQDGGVARLIRPHRGSGRLWVAELTLPSPPHAYLRRWGRPIAYSYVGSTWPISAYQTVYSSRPGSAEMPSAGRPFSGRVLDALAERGVAVEPVSLHTGVASLEADEPPYEEWFEVPRRTARAIRAARARGARVVAVGTTVVRALESSLDASGEVRATSGWTDLVITPERGIRSVDALLTGFHEPRASHLQMLAAIAGPSHLSVAYAQALDRGYLWHEFGDMHLIL
ncbi:MAG: S-adenosylmethionine:tRNA ribosyltransferase-isomerase [Dehalococcoidia bacterium]|nr:S-adenosylmethionine:tRNA ribosyltransferase-isomerase [Dehalococcoidia bacterium]